MVYISIGRDDSRILTPGLQGLKVCLLCRMFRVYIKIIKELLRLRMCFVELKEVTLDIIIGRFFWSLNKSLVSRRKNDLCVLCLLNLRSISWTKKGLNIYRGRSLRDLS